MNPRLGSGGGLVRGQRRQAALYKNKVVNGQDPVFAVHLQLEAIFEQGLEHESHLLYGNTTHVAGHLCLNVKTVRVD